MTAQIVYHNSSGNSIDMDTNDLTWEWIMENKIINHKSNKAASIVHDTNRVYRVFLWSCVLSQADTSELDGYIRPAAAPTYDSGYPKIVWTKDTVPTTETVLGAITKASGGMFSSITDAQNRVTITFVERYKAA